MRHRAIPFALAVLAFALPAAAEPAAPPLSAEQRAKLRCAAAFAIIARKQAQGDAEALSFPPLGERGRDYFVRAGAELMESAKLTREAYEALIGQEALVLARPEKLRAAMPGCMASLEASGL